MTNTGKDSIPKKTRKRKPSPLQSLYDNGKLFSKEFYENFSNFSKKFIYKYLIGKGYWKNHVRQSNYDLDDLNWCYSYVMGKVVDKYDPNVSAITTFMKWWIRGFATTVVQKEARIHNRIGRLYSTEELLEINSDYNIHSSFHEDLDDLTDKLDNDYFDFNLVLTKDEIEDIREKVNYIL